MLPSGDELTLGLMAVIIFEVNPFSKSAQFSTLLLFLTTFWLSCPVIVFSTAFDLATITSVGSKWRGPH
jgi:hypothetical protein